MLPFPNVNSLNGEVSSRGTEALLMCSQLLLCAVGSEDNPLGLEERKKEKLNVEITIWVDAGWTPKAALSPQSSLRKEGTAQEMLLLLPQGLDSSNSFPAPLWVP